MAVSSSNTNKHETVHLFIGTYKTDVEIMNAKVSIKRDIIKRIRNVIEKCQGRLDWKKKPHYWHDDVPFGDPNNNMKNNDLVTKMLLFLRKMWFEYCQTTQEGNFSSQPSVQFAPLEDVVELLLPEENWNPCDQYARIKRRLQALIPFFGPLVQNLLEIVALWESDIDTYHGESHELEAILGKLKICKSCDEKKSHLESLQQFVEKYRSALHSSLHGFGECETCLGDDEDPSRSQDAMGVSEHSERVDVSSYQEIGPEPELLDELVSLREDPAVETVSNLEKIALEMVEDQMWQNENDWGYLESTGDTFLLNFEADQDLRSQGYFTKHCELHDQLKAIGSRDRMASQYDLRPILKFWKELKGTNLQNMNETIVFAYLDKISGNHPTVCVGDYRLLGSDSELLWPEEKSKFLLLYKDPDDGTWSLLVADWNLKVIFVLDSMQDKGHIEKAKKLTQSFINKLSTIDGNVSDWKPIKKDCSRMIKDSALTDDCISAYFALMFVEAVLSDINPINLHQDLIPEFKLWLDFVFQCDGPSPSFFTVLFQLNEEICGVCSGVDPFPKFCKVANLHDVA